MALPSLKGVGIVPVEFPSQPKTGVVEVLKEVPEATKTVFGAIGKFGKEVGQGIARSFLATGTFLAGEPSYTPQTEIEKKIFGTDKPVSFRTIGENTLMIGGEDFKQKWGNYSIPVGMLIAGLDIVPIGFGKKQALEQVAKVISKTEEVARIAKTLKTVLKGSDDEIMVLAKSLKVVNKPEEVLQIIEGVGKGKEAIPVAPKALPEVIPAEKGIIPKELEPLAVEARKYKSAEEFVSAQKPYYSGGKLEIKQFGLGKLKTGEERLGYYLTSSKDYAKTFAGKEGKITEAFVDIKKPYLVSPENELLIEAPYSHSIFIKELKAKGYDSLLLKGQKRAFVKGTHDQLFVFDKANIKTKSQLTDFYTQAVKGVKEVKPPIKPPISEIIYKPELPDDPVQIVLNALTEAKPLRRVQETIYTKERGIKLAKAIAVGEKITGEAGFYAEKAALKGELTKVQFESIRNKLGTTDVVRQAVMDKMFIRVKESPVLSEWEKLPAREGLSKLFGQYGGLVPTQGELSLLEKVFGSEFISTVMGKRPFLQKLGEAVGQLANIPRSIMSSFDLSFGGRQGIFVAPRYRKEFWNSWKSQFKMFGSEKMYKEAMENVTKNKWFDLAQGRISFTELGRIMGQREERFMSQWAEKIPIVGKLVRASGRAYTGFANKYRMDIFASMMENAERLGLNPRKNLDLVNEIAEFVNASTGRGKLPAGIERSASILNAFFFSPRLIASRLELLIPAKYVMAEPFVRKEYLKTLFSFAGTAMTIMGLAKLAGAEVGADPRSADFAKIKIGDTRIDVLGGFQQYIRLAGQLISGEIVSSTTGKIMTLGEGYRPLTRLDILERFVEYKEAPIFSFITGLMKGQDFEGKPINVPKEVGMRFVPMALQDIYDIAKEDPDLLPLSVLGIFGVGLQTYKPRPSKTPTGFPSMKAGGIQMPSLKGVGSFK